MNKQLVASRTAVSFPRLGVLLLTLACLALEATPAPGAPPAGTAAVTAAVPTALPATNPATPLAFLNTGGSDQARMIQVGLVVIAIGIFLLSKSIR